MLTQREIRDTALVVVLGLVVGAGLFWASVAWGQPARCAPPKLAHLDEPTRALFVDAWVELGRRDPAHLEQVGRELGLSREELRGCRRLVVERGKPEVKPGKGRRE